MNEDFIEAQYDITKKTKIKKSNGIFSIVQNINQSKLFAGLVMISLNIGSKYITISLSKSQEEFLRNAIGHQILVFAMSWLGTRDIVYAIILTASFTILTQYLFNETSKFCIVPKQWQKFESVLDLNDDGKVEEKEIEEALKHLQKAKDARKKNNNAKK